MADNNSLNVAVSLICQPACINWKPPLTEIKLDN
jgi:hypothetical protein